MSAGCHHVPGSSGNLGGRAAHKESLHISPEAWGWVLAVFTVSYALFEIPTGRMGDRTGARRVLARVVLWWSAFTAFTGMTSNYYGLLLTRFCFGAGEAGALPNIGICLSRWFPILERARATGTVLMFMQIGGAIAPLVIVPIQMHYGWRTSFYVIGIAGSIGKCCAGVELRREGMCPTRLTHGS